ncbi:MAG: hypothetical protein II404_04335 [Prevotella sp.]|nr:hypothetical protein [Prevotella sp.]
MDKKNYLEPSIKVVQLKHKVRLMQGTSPTDGGEASSPRMKQFEDEPIMISE